MDTQDIINELQCEKLELTNKVDTLERKLRLQNNALENDLFPVQKENQELRDKVDTLEKGLDTAIFILRLEPAYQNVSEEYIKTKLLTQQPKEQT